MADATTTLNSIKREPYLPDEDDEDYVPLAFARSKKKPGSSLGDAGKSPGSVPKPKKIGNGPKLEPESDEDDTPISLASLKKKKLPNGVARGDSKVGAKVKVEVGKLPKVKKEEVEEDEDFDQRPRKKNIKEEMAKKKKKLNSGKNRETDRKERKVYSLPGQKADPPEERDPLRIFYETLHQQMPASEMAAIWMMERGLLPEKEASIVYAKKQKIKQQQIKSPIKAVSACKTVKVSAKKPTEEPKESPVKSKSKPAKKRKANDDSEEDDDDDFIMPLKKSRN